MCKHQDPNICYVTKIDGEIAGLVQINRRHKDEAEKFESICNLSGRKIKTISFIVHRKHQGKGIGTLLLKHITKIHEHDTNMYSAVYFKNNIASNRAFKKNNFMIFGSWGDKQDQYFVIKKVGDSYNASDYQKVFQSEIIDNKIVQTIKHPKSIAIRNYR